MTAENGPGKTKKNEALNWLYFFQTLLVARFHFLRWWINPVVAVFLVVVKVGGVVGGCGTECGAEEVRRFTRNGYDITFSLLLSLSLLLRPSYSVSVLSLGAVHILRVVLHTPSVCGYSLFATIVLLLLSCL
jgi:hypothetical protein